MKKIPITTGGFFIIDDIDYDSVNQWRWNFDKKHNVIIRGGRKKIHQGLPQHKKIRLDVFILGLKKGKTAYHKNGDVYDNRRENLNAIDENRVRVTKPPLRNNKSGFKGVYWSRENSKWKAGITVKGKKMHLGTFVNILDAARAYNSAALTYIGNDAYLNDLDDIDKIKLFELKTINDQRRKDDGFKKSIVQERITQRLKKVKNEELKVQSIESDKLSSNS